MALIAVGGSAVAQDEKGPGSDGAKHRGQQRGQHGELRGPEQMVRMMSRHLELDETQAQQIESVIAAAKPEVDALRDQHRTNRQAMRSLNVDDPDYGAQLDNLSAENGQLAAESTRLQGRIRADIHAVLTPEQQQKFDEQADRMRERGARGRRGSGPRHESQ